MSIRYTLITGASSGIGQGIAKRLSLERNLVLHGRDIEQLEKTRQSCKNSDKHIIWSFDLNSISDIEESLKKIVKENNLNINCFIHSAGIVKIMPMKLMDLTIIQEIMNVNTLSAMEIVRVLLKRRINKSSLENITFISSTSSKIGEKGANVYCASKGALDSFMRALAVELAPKVRVNSILPGMVKTRMAESWLENLSHEKIKERFLLGIGEIEDVVNMVEFIVSGKSRWITGQQIVLDGGRTIN